MILVRKSEDRGHVDLGWSTSHQTFSYANHHDRDWNGFRTLRVLNEERVQPKGEFGTHQHRNMEIISYMLDGALSHRDSMGNGSTIYRGDVQRLTAGAGIKHSEANPSVVAPSHFLQIWLAPSQEGLEPEYEQRGFSDQDKIDTFCMIVSPDGREGSLRVNQDIFMHASILDKGKKLEYILPHGRHAWIQVAFGAIDVNGHRLAAGDGAGISEERVLAFSAEEKSEFILINLG
jgi:redox-sensitive bicupin YhaK (pirin superfamily)